MFHGSPPCLLVYIISSLLFGDVHWALEGGVTLMSHVEQCLLSNSAFFNSANIASQLKIPAVTSGCQYGLLSNAPDRPAVVYETVSNLLEH